MNKNKIINDLYDTYEAHKRIIDMIIDIVEVYGIEGFKIMKEVINDINLGVKSFFIFRKEIKIMNKNVVISKLKEYEGRGDYKGIIGIIINIVDLCGIEGFKVIKEVVNDIDIEDYDPFFDEDDFYIC